jgi:catechol 2,3-dioxygenase-like lactoylglutathione lyase family enzyme
MAGQAGKTFGIRISGRLKQRRLSKDMKMATKYAHTNLIAKDWKRLSTFYQEVFGCVPIPPERDLSGEWLDKATGVSGAHISGVHLRLPGYGDDGPTLELFQYGSMPEHPSANPNTPGFSHIAFAVDDVPAKALILKGTLSRYRIGRSPTGNKPLHTDRRNAGRFGSFALLGSRSAQSLCSNPNDIYFVQVFGNWKIASY